MPKGEQAWSFSVPEDGTAFPNHLVDLVWSWGESKFGRFTDKPHSKATLETLVNEAFAASLQSEEGRPVRLQLFFNLNPHERQVTVTFDDPLPYSANNLVKLAPTIDIGFRWIVVSPEQLGHDTLKIIGISDPEVSQLAIRPMRTIGGGLLAHSSNVRGMRVLVSGPGCIRIETGAESFELRNCCIRFPFSVNSIKYVSEWYIEAAQYLDFSEMPVDSVVGEVVGWKDRRQFSAQALVRRTWANILRKVCNAKHGGTFLVIPKNTDVSGLLKFKYPLKSNCLQIAIQKRASFEPGLSNPGYRTSMVGSDLDDAHFSERDLARTSDLFASLASVDGAVVLECDLMLLGFGAEIFDKKFPQENELVEFGKHPHGKPDNKPLSRFGMRHRSAYRFCEKIEGIIAFVVSQDGDLRVFCNIGGKVILFEGPTPEDWVFSNIRSQDKDEEEHHKSKEQKGPEANLDM